MATLAALMNAGRASELEQATALLINAHPGNGVLWQLLAVSLAMQGRDSLTALQTAAHLLPGDAGAQFNLGNALMRLGRIEEATVSYRTALQIHPEFAQAHSNLGDCLQELGRFDDAVASYARALAVDHTLAETCFNQGNALRAQAKLDEAIASYRQALKLKPEMIECHASIGTALRLQGNTNAAEASCQHALQINADFIPAILVMAEVRADQGRFTEAEALFKQVIAADPHISEAWTGLTRIRTFTQHDAALMQIALQMTDQPLPPRRELYLRYALGKYSDDVKDFDQAFRHYHRANELAKSLRPAHRQQQVENDMEFIMNYFDRRFFEQRSGQGDASTRPVFIVGMLRSGTSLAEQILASHPAVFGAGELPFWGRVAAALVFSRHQATVTQHDITRVANDYLTLLKGFSGNAQRVIDKMPSNFLFMGLIHAVFPNARFIHMRRNPVDTCLSIYFQHFESFITYANDLHDLAHYWRQYQRLMQHWHDVLPEECILEVSYEALTEDRETCTRDMLAFIDLPWDPNCLDHTQANRSVITASKWQVRQKINRNSVERWRNYEAFVGPLKALLDE